MSVEKRINIRCFLQEKVVEAQSNGEPAYPLYLYVTYNRKNTHIRSLYGMFYSDLNDVNQDLIDFEQKTLEKIIRNEIERRGDKFTLKGLKPIYETYSQSIRKIIEQDMKKDLQNDLLKTNNEFLKVLGMPTLPTASFGTIYKASMRLFDNLELSDVLSNKIKTLEIYNKVYPDPVSYFKFDFATLIDWKTGTHQLELAEKIGAQKTKEIIDLFSPALKQEMEKLN